MGSYEAAPATDATSSGIKLKWKIWKKALALRRWGACEKLGVPMPDDRASLKDLGITLNPDQNDHSSNRCNRRCRVHGYTQLAMVGIAVYRVNMGHLDHSQQR
jgi:hypothetical protein